MHEAKHVMNISSYQGHFDFKSDFSKAETPTKDSQDASPTESFLFYFSFFHQCLKEKKRPTFFFTFGEKFEKLQFVGSHVNSI